MRFNRRDQAIRRFEYTVYLRYKQLFFRKQLLISKVLALHDAMFNQLALTPYSLITLQAKIKLR